MSEKILTISSPADLSQLLGKGIFKRKNKIDRIELNLDQLSYEDSAELQQRLNDLYSDCGCSFGSLVLIISMAIYFIYILFVIGIPNLTGYDLLVGVGLFFISAGIGKMVGIKLARIKFNKIVNQLVNKLSQQIG